MLTWSGEYLKITINLISIDIQVDVGGLMYFWGLHIDTVSTIVLILCTGLCVDYAAHIGHSFMVSRKGGKTGE